MPPVAHFKIILLLEVKRNAMSKPLYIFNDLLLACLCFHKIFFMDQVCWRTPKTVQTVLFCIFKNVVLYYGPYFLESDGSSRRAPVSGGFVCPDLWEDDTDLVPVLIALSQT